MLPEAWTLPFLAVVPPLPRLDPGTERVSAGEQVNSALGLPWAHLVTFSPFPPCLFSSSQSQMVLGHPQAHVWETISGVEKGHGSGLGLNSESTGPECQPDPDSSRRWPIHACAHAHTHFHQLCEPHTLQTATITSLLHRSGVRSHKQVTHLHHVHTYSTFTHCLSPSPALSPTHRLSQTSTHTSVSSAHRHCPRTLHVASWGALPTHCSLSWAPRVGMSEEDQRRGPSCSDMLRTWPGLLRHLLMGQKRVGSPKAPFLFTSPS